MSRTVWRIGRGLIGAMLVAAIGQACNAGSGDSRKGGSAIDAYENSYRRQLEVTCACDEEDLCVEARLADGGFDSCSREALDDPDAAPTLNCLIAATDRETECIKEDPCDLDHRDDCYLEWDHDAYDCPDLPDDVENDVDDCPDLFECVSGETIRYDSVCDGAEDCDDGSDEVPC